jgi:hypothetical protein
MVSFAFNIVFKTPVGLILLGYLVYRFYFKKKPEKVTEEEVFYTSDEETIEVNYEERE